MDWEEIVAILAIGAVVLVPGYWLFRDARRRGRNAVLWVTLYAIAAVPPTRLRFIFVPLVFGAWFLLRDRRAPAFRRVRRLARFVVPKQWRGPPQ